MRWGIASRLGARRTWVCRGIRVRLCESSWITHYRYLTYDSKEPETLDWIDRFLGGGDTFIDVGANIGLYTLYAALRHPRARIVAIEPEYSNLHLLKENLVANGLEQRVQVFSMALHDRRGVGHLYIQDNTPGAALHTVSDGPLHRTRAGRPVRWAEGVYMLTLDEFCEELNLRPNAVKIDVDGTEPEILAGARKTLNLPELRSVLLELPSDRTTREASVHALEAAGMVCSWRDTGGLSPNEVWSRGQGSYCENT
ncbi:MAG: FkbM family methyltransferase [Candidatus Omnitrophica bacterium]|nr:FkbM family methyltransferase [Candidatus Omnitrophota bacterium]